MTIFISNISNWRNLAVPLAVLFVWMTGNTSMAQGLDAQETIETIVGSQVEIVQETVATDQKGIIAAIENSLANAAEIRKRFSLDNVRIVFLPDLEKSDQTIPELNDAETEALISVRAAMEKFSSEITTLREEIQGSAIFYHAVNSRSILLNDIVAVQFGDKNDVTILVSGQKR